MKKILTILSLMLVAIVGLAGCSSSKSKSGGTGDAGFTFGQVTDSGGVTDKSFNQGAYEGLKKFSAANGLGDPQYLTAKTPQEMESSLNSMAEKAEVVVGSGFTFENPILNVAKAKTEKKFIIIDGSAGTQYPSNVANYSFAEQEAGYLAGVAAAKSTKTKKVGFIGGMEIPPVQKFGWGYIQGIKDTDPSIEIKYEYVGSFNDTALGKTKAAAFYGEGIDIIFCAAGGVGLGVINEAKEQRTQGKDIYVIGVDRDQYEDGKYDGDKSVVLTSAVKKVDEATNQAMNDIKSKNFAGGKTIVKTAKDGAVGIPEKNPNLSNDAQKAALDALEQIKTGKIVPADTKDKIKVTSGVSGNY